MEKLKHKAIVLLENVRKILDSEYKRNDMVAKEKVARLVTSFRDYPVSWASRIK